jgi:S1-C subfamily serine protease
VPINNAKKTISDLLSKGKVEYGWLGVQINDLDSRVYPGAKEDFKIADKTGAFVFNVFKGSPAYKAGVLPGDFITQIAGQNVRNADNLTQIVGNLPGDKDYELKLIRTGVPMGLTIHLAIRQEEKDIAAQSKNLWPGLYVGVINDEVRKQLKLPDRIKGPIVAAVVEGSAAAIAGVKQGDVVLKLNDRDIKSVFDFYKALNDAPKEAMLRLYREDTEVVIGLVK